MTKILLSLLAGLGLLFAGVSSHAGLECFAGTWKNSDPETGGLTTITINVKGRNIGVHVWGKCQPRDCDWGTVKARSYELGNPFSKIQADTITAVFSWSWSETLMVIKQLDANHLVIQSYTHFTDDSGRRDYVDREEFRRSAGAKQTEMYVLFDTTETGILSPSAPRKVSGIDEWPANLTVTNNLDLWLEIVPGISKKGVVLKDVECLASKWQDKTFGKAGLRLLPPKGEIGYNVIYRKAGVPFHAEARFGDFAASLTITKIVASLPVPGIGRLNDPVTFLEFWEKVRKIDSIQEAGSALKSGKIADASKKLISLLGEEKQLDLLRQAFAAFKIEVSKEALADFLTVSKISRVLNILGDQITLAIQTKAGAKPIRVSFYLEGSDRIGMYYENTRLRWSQLEKQLQRRYQLIPKLVDIVKRYVHQKNNVLAALTMLNQKAIRAIKTQEIAKANSELTNALYRLIVNLGKYPDLKSHPDYISLYDELGGIENRIAVTKHYYNQAVERYNYLIKRFSGNSTAFQPAVPFKVEQRRKKAKIVKF
ncbi:MAG: LemA family protein [Deltaproteobacteria bacterium]|nr:LemA family protein [Deltaproteobacteria bacterium]